MPNELTLTLLSRPSGHDSGLVGTLSLLVTKGTVAIRIVHEKSSGSLTLGVWVIELDVGGDSVVLQSQDSLDDAGDARCAFRVSDVGFYLWSSQK